MTGQTISHYTILEKLGEGGMGVVYKARDTKLDRDVALKFLPAHLGASENDKARFIQEAKASAALNHPNVASVIDIQEQPVAATPGAEPENRMFIIMEFVDGQTLREKMGSMSAKQATDIGVQIADGLAAAHDKGIVHRDIKPENIMVRKDGIAQIMDFGLAKLRGNVTRLTREGSTVGTAGYMSPEQVQGQDTDHRSDIFSMGVVLYELMSGQPPFKAAHESALMYEIVNVTPPPMASIKPEIDPELDRIILGCLEKEPGDRTQAAKQVSVDLKRFRRESGRQSVSRITAVHNVGGVRQPSRTVDAAPVAVPKGSMVPWIVAGLAVVAAVAALVMYFDASNVETPLFVASIPPPPASEYLLADGGHLAISPDGRMIASVVSDTSGKTMLWVRSLDSDIPRRLEETEGAEYPFWSYDSRFVGFFVPGKMKKVLATGGPPFVVCDAPSGRGASWNQDDVILFSPKFDRTGLSRVSAAGGPVTIVTTVDSSRNMSNARWPHFLPDGKHYFYTTQAATRTSDFSGQVYVASLDGSVDKRLFDLSTNVEYRDGKILYVRQDALVVQNFDAGTLEVSGDPTPIINKIGYAPNRSKGVFSSSLDGVLIYLTVTNQGRALAWVDTRQNALTPAANVIIDYAAYLSADDSRVFYDSYDPVARNYDIWMLDIGRGLKSRITFDPSDDSNPVPSHDGSRFVYTSWKEGVNIYIKSTAGTDEPSMILKSLSYNTPSDWSADGRVLLFQDIGKRADQDIWYLPMDGDRVKKPFIQTEFNEQDAVFSPDGLWVAYTSDESSRNEIYVRAFPSGEGKWQVSSSGGRQAAWGKDGKLIYYGSDRGIMATAVSGAGGGFSIGETKVVFRNPAQAGLRLHGVNRDGSKLLVSHLPTSQGAVSLTLITDWRKTTNGR